MGRRILTAREQHEMLSPWRLASGFDPFKVTHRLRDEFHDWFGASNTNKTPAGIPINSGVLV